METVAHQGLERTKEGSGTQAEGKPRRVMGSAETYQTLFVSRDLGCCTLGSFRGGWWPDEGARAEVRGYLEGEQSSIHGDQGKFFFQKPHFLRVKGLPWMVKVMPCKIISMG